MTTIDAAPLAEALQTLVDARLDTIDRMLLGRVNRQDRLAIVREVESQIFDLLQARDRGSLDRDDVLAVLARLDPPEAYLPEEGATLEARPARQPANPRAISDPASPGPGRGDLLGGILGIVSAAIVVVTSLIVFTAESPNLAEILIYAATPASFITSLLAIVFAGKARLRGPWAITGLATGILPFLISSFFGILILIHGLRS